MSRVALWGGIGFRVSGFRFRGLCFAIRDWGFGCGEYEDARAFVLVFQVGSQDQV